MMRQATNTIRRDISLGDAAIDGLFAGVLGGLVMGVYLALAGLLLGEGPAAVFSRFALSEEHAPLTGLLLHLAVSGIYGMLFGVIWSQALRLRSFTPTPQAAVLAGDAYGLLLVLVAWFILLPASGSPLRELPFLHFAIAHLIYGGVLGYVAYRRSLYE